jgi:hypothetical protein
LESPDTGKEMTMKQLIAVAVLFLGFNAAALSDENTIFPAALQSLISQSAYQPMTMDREQGVNEQTLSAFESAWGEAMDLFDDRISLELASRIPNPIQ